MITCKRCGGNFLPLFESPEHQPDFCSRCDTLCNHPIWSDNGKTVRCDKGKNHGGFHAVGSLVDLVVTE